MRGWLAAAMGLGLGLACSDETFECAGDHQCSLAGTPGTCVTGGLCAYPDPECASGLSFPLGSSSDQAGECVMDSGTGPADPSTDSSAGSADSSAGSADSSTGSGPDSSGSGVIECNDPYDPYEPNDSLQDAASITFADCVAEWDAVIADALDTDWFRLDDSRNCPLFESVFFTATHGPTLCMLPQCSNGAAPTLERCEGAAVSFMDGEACCGTVQVQLSASCAGDSPTLLLRVAADPDTPACLPYQASAFL